MNEPDIARDYQERDVEAAYSMPHPCTGETKREVVLVSRLRAALERLNPALPPEAITAAVDELTRDR